MNCRQQELIKNKALLAINMLGKNHVFESNEVIARKVDIKVVKEQSCNIVFAGDKICYRVIICNESCMDLNDLDFSDRLDTDTEYERNSFKVNGECKNPEIIGNSLCYHINRLRAKEEVVITFEAEVC